MFYCVVLCVFFGLFLVMEGNNFCQNIIFGYISSIWFVFFNINKFQIGKYWIYLYKLLIETNNRNRKKKQLQQKNDFENKELAN